jgi:2-oxoglutarate dehydrogenase E1 component
MNKTEATAAFEETSFLYGGNAKFVEELYQTYLNNPAAVDSHWRSFFDQMAGDAPTASGPSWARADWPPKPSDEQTAALDGNWAEVEKAIAAKIAASLPKGAKPAAPVAVSPAATAAPADDVKKATMDSVRALMMIRAYRMRGH